MSDLLLTALERLPQRVRRLVVAIGALLALGAVMAALTLTASHGGHERRSPLPRPAATVLRISPSRLPPPVPTAPMLQARRAAKRFLAGYLPFAYGRGRALAIPSTTQTLRRQLLLRQRAQLTPVERRRRPRVVALQTIGTTPTFVVATAVIDDGGVATYRLRFTLSRSAGRWAVSGVEEG
jgi:hypothetical protein